MENMDGGQVEYDMSFSTNTRINFLLWKCNQAQESDDAQVWFKNCKNLYKELFVKMNDGEKRINRDTITKCDKELNAFMMYNQNYEMNHDKMPVYIPPKAIFNSLFDWESALRQAAHKMGLLFKEGQDSYHAID